MIKYSNKESNEITIDLKVNRATSVGIKSIRPSDEPETEHTEDDGSNDESVGVSGDEMDIEWEVSVSLQTFFPYNG